MPVSEGMGVCLFFEVEGRFLYCVAWHPAAEAGRRGSGPQWSGAGNTATNCLRVFVPYAVLYPHNISNPANKFVL